MTHDVPCPAVPGRTTPSRSDYPTQPDHTHPSPTAQACPVPLLPHFNPTLPDSPPLPPPLPPVPALPDFPTPPDSPTVKVVEP